MQFWAFSCHAVGMSVLLVCLCVCVCMCLCVHVCMCMHVYMLVLGSLWGARTHLGLEGESSLFSCLQEIGWRCDELVEKSWSDVSFSSLKTGMQIQRVLELIYIYCSSLFARASIFPSSWQLKQTITMLHSLSSHFSWHSNSSLHLTAGFASFLSLPPSSPLSSISVLFNPPTTWCFHCAKETSRYLHGRLVLLQQGSLFVQEKVLTTPTYAAIWFQAWISANYHSGM